MISGPYKINTLMSLFQNGVSLRLIGRSAYPRGRDGHQEEGGLKDEIHVDEREI
jgi:hypothetical protein